MDKLYRSSDDEMVGGVLGGITKWLNINVVALRIITVLLALVEVPIYEGSYSIGSIVFWSYIILWIILKEE